MSGCLYVCGTPIGNLEDVSIRLLRILGEVDRIYCEDTRVTRILLERYSISTALVSCNHHQEHVRLDQIIESLTSGESCALLSDAGTPGICDPGYVVVNGVRRAGFSVEVIPGPSSMVALMSISGLPVDRFTFVGFAPKRISDWKEPCAHARAQKLPIVFFESPKRILATLDWIEQFDSKAVVVLGKELTKKFESVITGSPNEVKSALERLSPKGEWCGIVQFSETPAPDLAAVVGDLWGMGLSKRNIIDISTKILHINKNDVYDAVLVLEESTRN